MQKGFNQTKHPALIPDQYEMVYLLGMKEITTDPLFLTKWKELSPEKRGIIHQPVLSVSNGVNDNASAFLGLLNDLSYSGWNNGVPFIVDIWETLEQQRYNLDNIRQHGIYITEHYKPIIKPLLRVITSIWEKWYENNSVETMRLLNDYQILLCQPGATTPAKLSGIGIPVWWEYDWGLYANDPTGNFSGVVKPPVTPPPVEEPPVEEPEEIIVSLEFPKKWKISLLGGLIKGTIEVEE